MPTQVYGCKTHGEFDIILSFQDDVKPNTKCPDCGLRSNHILKPPIGIKIARTWNENANEWQRNSYTMAKAQSENMYNEQKDQGIEVERPTEASIQKAAGAIEKEKYVRRRPN
jgi:hypothetical protein